jgi:hypothetical protein
MTVTTATYESAATSRKCTQGESRKFGLKARGVGVQQSSVLSPVLFLIVLEVGKNSFRDICRGSFVCG